MKNEVTNKYRKILKEATSVRSRLSGKTELSHADASRFYQGYNTGAEQELFHDRSYFLQW